MSLPLVHRGHLSTGPLIKERGSTGPRGIAVFLYSLELTIVSVFHPSYTLGPEPKVLCGSWKEFDDTNYLRGCKW